MLSLIGNPLADLGQIVHRLFHASVHQHSYQNKPLN